MVALLSIGVLALRYGGSHFGDEKPMQPEVVQVQPPRPSPIEPAPVAPAAPPIAEAVTPPAPVAETRPVEPAASPVYPEIPQAAAPLPAPAPEPAPAPQEAPVTAAIDPGAEARAALLGPAAELPRASPPETPQATAKAAPRARASAPARDRSSSKTVVTARSVPRTAQEVPSPLMEDVQRLNRLAPPRLDVPAPTERPPAVTPVEVRRAAPAARCDRYNPFGELSCLDMTVSPPGAIGSRPGSLSRGAFDHGGPSARGGQSGQQAHDPAGEARREQSGR